MRQLVICSLVLLIGLPVIGFCQDEVLVCPYAGKCRLQAQLGLANNKKCCQDAKKCCAEATACQTNETTVQADATACKCKAGACQSATACQGDETPCEVASNACSDESAGCQKSKVACAACPADERIKHLQKAAKHLQAAGLESEARQVLAAAHVLCNDLLERKIAELQRVQAEVLALERTTSQLQSSTTRK